MNVTNRYYFTVTDKLYECPLNLGMLALPNKFLS